ncbi:MarR family transcriptional regulator [Methylobacterium variabile]|jgi:MarR family transcriptional regulator for hemolysin|uniref:MarR family transcriptional regulator n=1 Tax=Methylobacterium variabile TaxID=298794 RepID=A0A0J6SBJ4_9HYPH|nr:MarR family transcriptional regulator [Methylobacterium variabile]KMO31132.1 MarR family transcriptional regulator [Methylobacterium variabile]
MRRDLLQSLTLTLLQAGRVWRRAADEVVTAYGLTEATALPLLLIGRLGGDPRQTVLAEALGVEGPSLVRLLDQLCDAGLVIRREDPTDRRAKVLHLTAEGRARAAAIEARFDTLRDAVFASVDDGDLRATLRVLRALQADGGEAGARGASSKETSLTADAAPALRLDAGARS